MNKYGFVYVLSNESMPSIYKIGYTDRSPLARVDELSKSTSVPTQFKVVCYGEIDDAHAYEAELHEMCAEYRINQYREFFKFDDEFVARQLYIWIKESCTHFSEGEGLFDIEERIYLKGAKANG